MSRFRLDVFAATILGGLAAATLAFSQQANTVVNQPGPTTGSGNWVRATSPTLTTPSLGVTTITSMVPTSGNVICEGTAGSAGAPGFRASGTSLLIRTCDDLGDAPIQVQNVTSSGSVKVSSSLTVGSTSAFTLNAGELAFAKVTASGSGPGAAGGKMALVCGTNAGTAKLIAYAGTSGTAVTVTDNIGSGVTGC